ncbi:MAG TPA: hypothetical protein P5137_01435 [Candidatus Brocadiia bacterium]|nr:hypothetical protein [Candidatus Brocadiia bacterium]
MNMPKLLLKRRKVGGWSLIELTIILIVLAILCAILAPVIGRFVRNAKIIRCREDVQCLGNAIHMFMMDNALFWFRQVGTDGASPEVDLAVTDGHIPMLNPLAGVDSPNWVRPVNLTSVDFLEYHLCTNTPGYNPANAYYTPATIPSPFPPPGNYNAEFAWRGPYMTPPLDPDPWGNRYMSNVGYLRPTFPPNLHNPAGIYDCVVLSAGPDGEVDTAYTVDGLTPGDDDLFYTVQ